MYESPESAASGRKYHVGSDEKTQLHLYRLLIRSKLDYGTIIYRSACKSYLVPPMPWCFPYILSFHLACRCK